MIFAHVTAHNTSSGDDSLECGLFIDDGQNRSAAVETSVDGRRDGECQRVGAMSLTAPTEVTLTCDTAGSATFDLSNV